MTRYSRRELLILAAASALVPGGRLLRRSVPAPAANPLRLRTITAGIPLQDPADLGPIEKALAALDHAKAAFVAAGYEVQTTRIATAPFVAGRGPADRDRLLPALQHLDGVLAQAGVIASLGPVLMTDAGEPGLADWIGELVRTTSRLSLSVSVASPTGGVWAQAAGVAAAAIATLARVTPGGAGNFRFAATACIPAGTPFFPAAWHLGEPSLALGFEAAGLVRDAIAEATTALQATGRLQTAMNAAFVPAESVALRVARQLGRRYLGIDPSPAPGLDRSIGTALEAFTKAPFGAAGTLEACGAVTAALKHLAVRTCGYAGLMLPVLEDPCLAQRASEGRYSVRDLLLYSSVCGTGLDVVPIPGDTSVELLAAIIRDVAALAVKWRKPLSARLFPIPGRGAGETTAFNDPLLTNCRILPVA